ncbi:lysozyme g-like isoform X1 [Echeneis naucrates]|uniref:lysozyme g-like isoform X1 n=1 Tax=Echeneis naucrates TaxID=173247 RepID=UPI001114507B|nr:lysozyme g-like isoform X1 [Echeneis naucrates]
MGYADIMRVPTTGASWKTSQQDSLGYSGVKASHTMAQTDQARMGQYRSIIVSVGNETDIDPALIAGIISRESRAGNALVNGWGDSGRAWGLMQVDITSTGGGHSAQGAWDSKEHIKQATGILVYFIGRISQKFPGWSREEQLKGLQSESLESNMHQCSCLVSFSFIFVSAGGIAAYNMGDGNVVSKNVDERTTGGDYSNDVVARAQWYKNNGF